MPDPVLFAKAVIAAAVASVLVTLAIALFTAILMRKAGWQAEASSTSWVAVAAILGIGLGAALGFSLLGDLPPRSLEGTFPNWSLNNVLDRFLSVILPLAALVELLGGFPKVPRWLVWILRLGLAAGVGRILLHGSSYLLGTASDWTAPQIWTALGLGTTLLAAVWVLLAWLVRRRPGISVALVLSPTCLAVGMTVMLSGYLDGGAVGLPLAAALAGSTVAVRLLGKAVAIEGAVGIGLVGLFSILMMGRFFGDLSTGRAVTLLLAPLLCWASELPILRARKPWVIAAVRLVLVAIPLAFVLGLAKHDFDRDNAEVGAALLSERGEPRDLFPWFQR